jgi:molybdopterin converting factor small subunit
MFVYTVRCVLTGKGSHRLRSDTVSSEVPLTAGGLLERLVATGDLEPLRGDDTPLLHQFVVLVNGRSVHSRDGQDTLLTDGDTVSVLLPVAGG